MTEFKLVIDGLTLSYEGFFDVRELYKIIDDWLKDNRYDKKETVNQEIVKEDKKQIMLILEPWKGISDYIEYRFQMRVMMSEVKEVDVEKDGVKMRLQKGKVEVNINAFLVTDRESKWKHRPLFFFIRVLVDKFIYKFYTDKFESGLKTDVTNFHTTLKAFLNLYRYK